MDANKAREYLTEREFLEHSIWVRNAEDDLIYPVYNSDDLPEDMSQYDLRIRAILTTPTGNKFKGYIVGVKNIYAITIFYESEVFRFNKNLLTDCLTEIARINLYLDKMMKPEDFSPLQYETTIDIDAFNNFNGEFDIFNPMTDEERLAEISDEEQ